jgi:hypothetical protein
VFHLDVVYVYNGFQVFFQVFFCKCSDACFECFICFLLYVAIVASECFKSRSGVGHGMRVGRGWRRGRHLGWRGPAAGVLARMLDTLRCLLAR